MSSAAKPEPLRRNMILARLPDREFVNLADRAEIVEVELRQQIYMPGERIEDVFFPMGAVFSIVAMAEENVVIEIATTGREGMVGLPVFLGAASSPHASFCQIPGPAARLAAPELRDIVSLDGTLRRLLSRYVQATLVQIAQNVVCNNAHTVEQRAARWLLATHDRAEGAEFPLTQEFLGQMLGVRRPTVSETASQLQARGLIRYRRGVVAITDRGGLEAVACECYALIKAEFDSLTKLSEDP